MTDVTAFTTNDVATLEAVFGAAAYNLSSGDLDGWIANYAPEAVLLPPNASMRQGRTAIVEWARALGIERVRFGDVRVAGEGNMAYGISTYELQTHGAPLDRGKQLVVFRRAPGHTWQAHAVCFNSDGSP